MTISSRIRAWRRHLGLTQEQFSALTGLHIGVLRKYENDVNVPGGEALIAIGRTGVDLNWLLLGEGNMVRQPRSPNDERYLQQLGALCDLLNGLDDCTRNRLIDEFITRAHETKRLADLEELVNALKKKVD